MKGQQALLPAKDKKRRVAGPCHWRCHKCGEEFTAWAKAERHADAEMHLRIEVVLGEK